MPYIHKTLATAFTGIQDRGKAPEAWAFSKVTLKKKNEDGPNDDRINFRMISLTLNIGKLYHSLEAQRTINFIVSNKYLDPITQKNAYIEGINGCIEHVTVEQQIFEDAKQNNKTVHITWVDLKDAFQSACHMLLPYEISLFRTFINLQKYL